MEPLQRVGRDVLAVFASRHLVENGDALEGAQCLGVDANQLIGPANEDRLLRGRQFSQ